MASWYCRELGDGVEAFLPTAELEEMLLDMAMKKNVPIHNSSDVAVFSRYDLETNVVTIYFSPSAKLAAIEFGAISCKKPVYTENLAFVFGDVRARDLHFPDYRIAKDSR